MEIGWTRQDRSKVSYKIYSFEAKLKDCKVPIKFVVVFGKWSKEDDKKFHILITNQLKAPSRTVIKNYLLRWGIEYCFKELKYISLVSLQSKEMNHDCDSY